MLWSNYFIPTQKEKPIDAKIPSHQLMIRSGMIKQESAGIYSWLPIGLKVLKKIETIVRDEQERAGAIVATYTGRLFLLLAFLPASSCHESAVSSPTRVPKRRVFDQHPLKLNILHRLLQNF